MRSAGNWLGSARVWAVVLVVVSFGRRARGVSGGNGAQLDGTSLTTGLAVLAAGVLIFRERWRR